MGILLIDKNADYSSSAIGYLGISISVTDGLESLFELRTNSQRASRNLADDNTASVAGSPTFGALATDFNAIGQMVFPTKPSNLGENTIAFLLKIKNGGTSSDGVVGSLPASPNSNGSIYITQYNRRVQLTTSSYPTESGGSSTNVSAYLDMPASGELDGSYQLFFATVKSGVGVTLQRPLGNSVASAATSNYFYYNPNSSNNYKVLPLGSGTQSLGLFASWNRVLTSQEITTFYNEAKAYYEKNGLAI